MAKKSKKNVDNGPNGPKTWRFYPNWWCGSWQFLVRKTWLLQFVEFCSCMTADAN